ncbi:hypothetical protein WA026_010034 [Henosepilachna vigintioctopunctata]|uniref:BCL-6 corepressor n=1 Tax=Henosepilachna vigintioctopunctata TaxID=420089 RepID=A0AAW1UBY7_9CUCU
MDVTFTNVLEGARQYFQGLPMGSSSAASPIYPSTSEPSQRSNNESTRPQEVHPSTSPYWMGQPETRSLPVQDHTPTQRPPSYNSDSSRPPSHSLYVNTSQEQRTTPNFPSSFPEQYQQQQQYNQHQQQQSHHTQQHAIPQQQHLQHTTQKQQHSQQLQQQPQLQQQQSQQQQQQMNQQQNSQDFQFTRPLFREAPSNLSHHYTSHILQNSPYHPPSPHNPTSPHHQPPSPQQQRKVEHNVTPPQSLHAQITPVQTSTSHASYQQSRTYYPATSYENVQVSSNNKNYLPGPSYPYQQTAQLNNSNYFKNVYQSQSSSSSVQYNPTTVTHSANQDHQQKGATFKMSSRTHNLPPIAQLSDNYSKSVREHQKPQFSKNQSTSSSGSNSTSVNSKNPNANTHKSITVQGQPTHQNFKSEYQYQNRTNQPYLSSTQTLTTTSLSYNTVTTCRSNSSFQMNTLSSSATHQFTPKLSTQETTNRNYNVDALPQQNSSLSLNTPNSDKKRVSLGNKHKRESPLDLSVKTVRTPADSTLGDTENERSHYFASHRVPPISTSSSTLDPYINYQRNSNTQRRHALSSASAPKVDFMPNFNVSAMGNTHINFRQDQRPMPVPFQNPASRNPRLPFENANTSASRDRNSSVANRYPVVSVPSIASVNNYMQTSANDKNSSKILPRIDFPTVGHSLKTSALYPSQAMESHRKRPADTAPSIVNKVARVESWRQTIDQQIEQKLSTYKPVQQSSKQHTSSKSPVHNGNFSSNIPEKSNDLYVDYNRSQYQMSTVTPQQPFGVNEYHSHSSHSQTYVPLANHQYNINSNQTVHQNSYAQSELIRTNSNSSLSSVKSGSGGAADKRVLTLLRNSIETKGVKEAQRKYEQEQYNKYSEQPHHRSDIQQPSTHVTAPLQPKPTFMGRQNVSPFTPNSLPEGNNTTPIYNKLHVPRAVDSINFDVNKVSGHTNKQLTETVISDQNNPNGDLDGLAAFLAARIRTKAELKQVSPTQQANNNSNSQIHNTVENVIRNPLKQDSYLSSFTSGSSTGISPPKLTKEYQQSQQPRKRLFSRTEDEIGRHDKRLPSRDKSGMRSSSETSVFDFPDSGSDGEMPVLEMQSLNAMRRDRKSSLKQPSAAADAKDVKEAASPNAVEQEDDIFLQTCDTFMDQLKAGVGKKRGRRKKTLEPEVLAKLETVTKEKPIAAEITVKEEILDGNSAVINTISHVAASTMPHIGVKPSVGETVKLSPKESEIPTLHSLQVKEEVLDNIEYPVEQALETTVKVLEDQSDSDTETIVQLSNKLKSKALSRSKEDTEVNIKPNDVLALASKPPKKPAFGDGSAFCPGWEEEVYNYKKSLRMPPSLIQVTRPPSALRLSTSLPDLDPCPSSPASSIVPDKDEDSKSIFNKVKSEPLDSDIESNSSFNLFNNKNNYDSEGSASIKSLPTPVKDSIVDKLLQKCGKRKKRKYKKREEEGPKIIPKAENPIELLPTPSLEIESIGRITKEAVIKTASPILGFRKSTIENFKDAFLNRGSNIVGMNEQFSTVILKSRTRKETRVLKQRATIKEVFGEDRPASAPPVTCVNPDSVLDKKETEESNRENEIENDQKKSPTHVVKKKLIGRGKTKNNLLKSIADRKLRAEVFDEAAVDEKPLKSESRNQSPSTFSEDLDNKSETPSLDGDDSNNSMRKRGKFNKFRRKFSSGFDYIRKKKKQVKKENDQNDISLKKKRRDPALKATPESEQDIQKEIKSWVLNKGIGETHLHRSARLGYTDITAFCLEKMDSIPSPKDNAGYTPLHEACSRGHLDIARLLLMYGASVSESAKGGVRPLHEAVENGFLEVIRLLLSYGADPRLATYAGLTPLSLATDEATRELLQNHLDDLEGKSTTPWQFHGPASCFDPKEHGYNVFSSPPHQDSPSEEEDIEIEVSEFLLPNLYTLRGEAQGDRWILLQDLSNILKIKSRDALLKQLCPTPSPGISMNYKSFLRELKMSDFMEQAHCCQFLNASEKINTRASKIALVKYTDKIRELLKIEKVVITKR